MEEWGERAKEFSEYYNSVYRDDKIDGPHGGIQWKGTFVCMDMYCECGEHGHIDDEFLYYYECVCGRKYAVGTVVKLIPMTEEQIKMHKKLDHIDFKRSS